MNYLKSLLCSVLLVICAGCNRSEETTLITATSISTFVYQARDLSGIVVATGKLTLSFEGTAIMGQRDIKGNVLEAGMGNITGETETDGTVQIELNPGSVAVVILKGKREGETLTGDRLFDSGPVPRKIGTFVATQALAGAR